MDIKIKSKSLKKVIGIIVGILFWIINIIAQMYRVKIILCTYGSEINGLVQTSNQLFSYLVIIEGGISSAYMFKMYIPMRERNYGMISEVFNGLKISMMKISQKMLLALIPMSVAGIMIISQENLGRCRSFIIIVLIGIRFIIPYFCSLSYKALLNVHDYKYLVDVIDMLLSVCVVVVESIIATYSFSIITFLFVGIISNIFISIVYIFVAYKFCIKECLKHSKPDFYAEKMTKDILAHQISNLVNCNVDSVLLSAKDISSVTIYQGYMQIVNSIISLVNRISDSYKSVIGIKISDPKNNAFILYQKILSFHILSVIFFLPIYISRIEDFISLWLGPEYILNKQVIYTVAAFIVLRMISNPYYLIVEGRGMYRETRSCAIWNAIINFIMSLLLVWKYGVVGVILATDISYLLIVVPVYTRLMYNDIFKRINTFVCNYFLILIGVFISLKLYNLFIYDYPIVNWIDLLSLLIKQGIISLFVGILLVYIFKGKYFKRNSRVIL